MTIHSSSPPSFTPSSSLAPSVGRRCSGTSSRPRWSAPVGEPSRTAMLHQRPTTLVQPATASALERRLLGELFVELCRIESPSGRERACGERVAAELRGLGLEVSEDDAGVMAGSGFGNFLGGLPPVGRGCGDARFGPPYV